MITVGTPKWLEKAPNGPNGDVCTREIDGSSMTSTNKKSYAARAQLGRCYEGC